MTEDLALYGPDLKLAGLEDAFIEFENGAQSSIGQLCVSAGRQIIPTILQYLPADAVIYPDDQSRWYRIPLRSH